MKLHARPAIRPKRKSPTVKPRVIVKPRLPVVINRRKQLAHPLKALQHQLEQRRKSTKRCATPPSQSNRRPVVVTPSRGHKFSRNPASTRIDRLNKRITRHHDKVAALKNSGVGRYLVILACGPSIKYVKIEKFAKHPFIDVMTINKPNMRLWPTKYWAFCDQSQYKRNMNHFKSYNGTLINASSVKVDRENQIIIRNIHGRGFSKDLFAGYYLGRSSTYANLQTAYWMNYDKVFIFGCDMAKVDGALHFYGVNPDVRENIRESRFQFEAEHYDFAVQQLSVGERKRFYFCSRHNPWSFIEKFNRMDERTAADEIITMAGDLK